METDKLPTGKALILCTGYTRNQDGTYDVHGSCGGVVSPFVPSQSKWVKVPLVIYTETFFPQGLAGTATMLIVGYGPQGNEMCRMPVDVDGSLDGSPDKNLVTIWDCDLFFWELTSMRLELRWGDRVLATCALDVVGPDEAEPGRLLGVATAATTQEVERLLAAQPKAEATAA
jgi:hypothetical protein